MINSSGNFSFNISHLKLISHLSFIKSSMINAKSLKIDNCKLIIAATEGAA